MPDGQQTIALFGNANPQMQVPILHPETGEEVGRRSVAARHIDQSVTRVELWEGVHEPENTKLSLSTDNDRLLALIGRNLPDEHRHYAVALRELEDVVAVHTGGMSPAWFSSNNEEFAQVAAKHFGSALGEPVALLTNGGRDALHAQHWGTSAQPAAFNYMALANAATATTPNATDSTLTGEFATAGLTRAQATYAHTAGTNTTTLTKTYTAQAADVAGGAVTASQIGVFNALAAGTMAYKTALNSNATLNVAGDSATVTETGTAG